MLAAKSLGLETCPVGMGKYIEETPGFSKLDIPRNENVMLAIILGYGKEKASVHPRNKENVVCIE